MSLADALRGMLGIPRKRRESMDALEREALEQLRATLIGAADEAARRRARERAAEARGLDELMAEVRDEYGVEVEFDTALLGQHRAIAKFGGFGDVHLRVTGEGHGYPAATASLLAKLEALREAGGAWAVGQAGRERSRSLIRAGGAS